MWNKDFVAVPDIVPKQSEGKGVRESALNTSNGAEEGSPWKYCILKLGFSIKDLKITQIKASKISFMQMFP